MLPNFNHIMFYPISFLMPELTESNANNFVVFFLSLLSISKWLRINITLKFKNVKLCYTFYTFLLVWASISHVKILKLLNKIHIKINRY